MPCAPLALALVAGAGLSACGSDTPPEVVVTVTGTPAGAASSAGPTPSSTASAAGALTARDGLGCFAWVLRRVQRM